MTAGTISFMGKALPITGNATMTGETAATDVLNVTGLATQTGAYFNATVSSTAAITAGDTDQNAFNVTVGAFALNGAYAVTGQSTGTVQAFCIVHGSKAPSYFISVGATTAGVGAATDNGFFEAATRFLSAPSTAITYGAVKILAGSKVYYLPAVPDTGMADT